MANNNIGWGPKYLIANGEWEFFRWFSRGEADTNKSALQGMISCQDTTLVPAPLAEVISILRKLTSGLQPLPSFSRLKDRRSQVCSHCRLFPG